MEKYCEDRVAVITGAGRGLGREYALQLAAHGAKVVVNDLGGGSDGAGADVSAAASVVAEIRAAGGQAVSSGHDVSDTDGAAELVQLALDSFGSLDVLVNNAGILRDRTIASMSVDEWDDVVRVHLRGTFATTHHAARHWRDRSKREGGPIGARLINTTSASGLYCAFGQSNYGAAKAGIASFTIIASQELARYGVTANAIAPEAKTRLTAPLMPEGIDADPAHVAPVVVWLASAASAGITGRVFDVGSGRVSVAEQWRRGPEQHKGSGFWTPAELSDVLPRLVDEAAPNVTIVGRPAEAVGA